MEKIKAFFSNYKSDILNVLGVVALIAVVVVGAVLFFGKDKAQPNIVEDTTVAATTEATTETETTTTEPETTTEATTETTTKVLTTTTKPAQKPAETPTKAPVNNTPNNTPVNKEEGTLPDALNQGHTPGDGTYEMELAGYNEDANIMAAYNDALSRGVKPISYINKKGTITTYYETGWDMPYDTVVICNRCGKPQGHGTHGTCATAFSSGRNCDYCGEWISGNGCHTCKY